MLGTVVLAASSNAEQIAACGAPGDQNWLCTQVYRVTGSERAAEVTDALATPLGIVLVVIVAWLITLILRRIVERMVMRIRDQGSLSVLAATARIPMSEQARLRRAQRAATVSSVLRNVVSIVVWSLAVLVILGELGIDIAPIIAGAGVAGIALGFGAQTMVRDYLAGLYVVLEDQYGVGDEIEIGAVKGTVEWVSLRMTRVRDAEGVSWYIGNGEIRVVGNRSQREAPGDAGGPEGEDPDDPDR
ncbi:MAG: hypothetical protein AMXMBFR46_27110 [Acidimicrobiia bacterium]